MLNLADILTQGQGDGRISESDMAQLLNYECDEISKIKDLFQIYTNYNLTDSAKELLYKSLIIKK